MVYYSLTSPLFADLLAVARQILTGVLSGQVELLEDLQTPVSSAASNRDRSAPGSARRTAR